MARKVLKKLSLTFYDGDEELLDWVLTMSKEKRQSQQGFILSLVEEKMKQKEQVKEEVKPVSNPNTNKLAKWQ